MYEEIHAHSNCHPKRGKNKKKAKANADSRCLQLAEYAARLVFHFLSKVRCFKCTHCFKMLLSISQSHFGSKFQSSEANLPYEMLIKHFHCSIMKYIIILSLQVFTGWKDIAEVIRNRVFKEDEQHLIDIFDIQVCYF